MRKLLMLLLLVATCSVLHAQQYYTHTVRTAYKNKAQNRWIWAEPHYVAMLITIDDNDVWLDNKSKTHLRIIGKATTTIVNDRTGGTCYTFDAIDDNKTRCDWSMVKWDDGSYQFYLEYDNIQAAYSIETKD